MADIRSIALSLIGGSPLNKVRRVIANNLPVTVAHDIAGLDGLLGQVLNGNLASVLQNPLAAVTSNLSSLASDVAGQLGGIADLGDLASSLSDALTGAGGLTSALSDLSNVTGLLSGVASAADGQFGLSDVMSAASTLEDLAGVALPAGLDMGTILAPFDLASSLSGEVTDYLGNLSDAISSGAITAADAISQIGDYTAQITGALGASSNALTTLHGAAQGIASLGAVAGNLIGGPQSVQGFLTSIVHPSAMPQLQTAINDHLAAAADPDAPSVISEADTLP